jgi:hypothetical protein
MQSNYDQVANISNVTSNNWTICGNQNGHYVPHSLHLSSDGLFLYFMENVTLFQVNQSNGNITNSLMFDPSGINHFHGLDISSDDSTIVLGGYT